MQGKMKILGNIEMIINRIMTFGSMIWNEEESIMERIRMEREKWKKEKDYLKEQKMRMIMEWKMLRLEVGKCEKDREDSSTKEGKVSKQEETEKEKDEMKEETEEGSTLVEEVIEKARLLSLENVAVNEEVVEKGKWKNEGQNGRKMEDMRSGDVNNCYFGNTQEKGTFEKKLKARGKDGKIMNDVKRSEIKLREEKSKEEYVKEKNKNEERKKDKNLEEVRNGYSENEGEINKVFERPKKEEKVCYYVEAERETEEVGKQRKGKRGIRNDEDERDKEKKRGTDDYKEQRKTKRKVMDTGIGNSDEDRFCDVDKILEEVEIEIMIEMTAERIKEDKNKIGELLKRMMANWETYRGPGKEDRKIKEEMMERIDRRLRYVWDY